ncbi:hypothetical protein PFICI_13965 [Pestalotiopsis fici W106-1]|uniref:Uncharacterized protein n=1 Tax=Pestalotiopsis fici (strain W106-1 / CGMCC3.15140) TaxID=1229662 RepID=W3WJZ4_PESFW|nr:uncharacterized protein PFICI_13965 [Pestalotiopsis fici W106-1]ETS74099.1 hypothetical protein PFICI_13965 [Pestalotiopsis fici W106-1]
MRSVPQPPSNLGRDALGAAHFSGGQGDSQHPSSHSVRPTPQSSASLPVHSTPNTHAIQAFYNTANQSSAPSSMHDLSRPGPGRGPGQPPQLKSVRSTPDIRMRRMDSFPTLMSSLDAGAPPPPPSSGRQKPRVNPLDVHFARDPSAMPMPLTHSPLSRSPLARDEGPMMMMTTPGTNDMQSVPKALNIVKAPPSPAMTPAIPPRSALRKPPSPAPSASMASSMTTSVDGDGLFVRDLEKPIMPAAADSRPSSRGSNRNIPSTLRELMAVDEFLCESPVSVPTPPPSLPRASNDSGTRSLSEPEGPVVQTVRAKRETMTVSPAKKRSLEKMIEAFDKSLRANGEGIPRSSSEPRAERPAPLKVKTVLNHTATVQGPSSAPVAPRQRSESPFGRTPTPLGRARAGVPAAAVGAQGRPSRPGVRRPTINEYGVAPIRPVIEIPERGSTPSSLRSPPDSPILPSHGPLSSISPPDSPILPTEGPLSANSPPDSPILPSFGPLSAGSPPDSPILPSRGPLSAGSPPSSPILPSHGPLSAGSSPPDSPILPSRGPLSAGSPPDSPIIPAEGPLSNPASPPDSPIMPLSGPLAYNQPVASKKDDPPPAAGRSGREPILTTPNEPHGTAWRNGVAPLCPVDTDARVAGGIPGPHDAHAVASSSDSTIAVSSSTANAGTVTGVFGPRPVASTTGSSVTVARRPAGANSIPSHAASEDSVPSSNAGKDTITSNTTSEDSVPGSNAGKDTISGNTANKDTITSSTAGTISITSSTAGANPVASRDASSTDAVPVCAGTAPVFSICRAVVQPAVDAHQRAAQHAGQEDRARRPDGGDDAAAGTQPQPEGAAAEGQYGLSHHEKLASRQESSYAGIHVKNELIFFY